MKVYKVVKEVRGKLVSLGALPKKYTVTYTPGVWAEAEHGPLFAYKQLEEARQHDQRNTQIWVAEAEDPVKIRTIIHIGWAPAEALDSILDEFWRDDWAYRHDAEYADHYDPDNLFPLYPAFMTGYSRIKLLRRL